MPRYKVNAQGEDAPKVEIVNFTIKCAYTPSKAPGARLTQPDDGIGPGTGSGTNQAASPFRSPKTNRPDHKRKRRKLKC